MKEEDRVYLLELAQALDDAVRVGLFKDRPEGVRYIRTSDTLAGMIAARLRKIALSEDKLLRAWLAFSREFLSEEWWMTEAAEARTMEGSHVRVLQQRTSRFLEEESCE